MITTLVLASFKTANISPENLKLFKANYHHAVVVEEEFVRRGFGNPKCLQAIHVNTFHESKWNPDLISGNFVGIFQIGGRRTMGAGTSVAQRKDIKTAVNIIASKDYFVAWYKKHKYHETTLSDATYGFAKNVLRCAERYRASRSATARKWTKP